MGAYVGIELCVPKNKCCLGGYGQHEGAPEAGPWWGPVYAFEVEPDILEAWGDSWDFRLRVFLRFELWWARRFAGRNRDASDTLE